MGEQQFVLTLVKNVLPAQYRADMTACCVMRHDPAVHQLQAMAAALPYGPRV